jgi:predicted nucleic acid-binding protein
VKVLIDTNVVFDVIERRQPHYAASLAVLKMARRGEVAGAVASHTLANAFYRYGKRVVPFLTRDLLSDLQVCCGDSHECLSALRLGMADLEDALQVAAAHAFKAHFILTRNGRHFRRSNIPALSPAAWLRRDFPRS